MFSKHYILWSFFPVSFLLLDFSLLLEAASYSMAATSRQCAHNLSLDDLCVRDRSLVSLYSQRREVCIFVHKCRVLEHLNYNF